MTARRWGLRHNTLICAADPQGLDRQSRGNGKMIQFCGDGWHSRSDVAPMPAIPDHPAE
jgi:hypothetical protein